MMKTPPSNMDNVIDSRDIIERIEELEAEEPETESAEAIELDNLKALAEGDAGTSPDWPHGETLIRDSYFQEHAQELAEDCGVIHTPQGSGSNWPNNCIDWEQAARELQMDYMLIEFDRVDYWIRA